MLDKLLDLAGKKGPTGRLLGMFGPSTQPNYTNVGGSLGKAFNNINQLEDQAGGGSSRKAPLAPKGPIARQARKKTSTTEASFKRGDFSKGGLVSHKSVFDLE